MIHEIHMWKTHGTHFVFSFCITCLNFTCVMKKKRHMVQAVSLMWHFSEFELHYTTFLSFQTEGGSYCLSLPLNLYIGLTLCSLQSLFAQYGSLRWMVSIKMVVRNYTESYFFSNYLVLQVQKSNLKKYLNSSEKKVQRKIKYCKIVIKSKFVSFLALNP